MEKCDLNRRVSAIAPSATLAITSKAKAMASEGKTVFSFAAGEPDFDTPEHIKQAAVKALADGQTKYAPVAGLPALREALCEKLSRENGLTYAPDQIVVSCGAKHSLFNVVVALCDEGDEVIVPTPYWLSYPEMIRMAGATPVFAHCREANDFKLTAEEFEGAVTERTKALILNSPSNPIGVVYTRGEIEALVELAVRRGIVVISDEIYEKLLYEDAEHVSAGALSGDALAHTVTVNGFSKAYSMTGWRLGYTAAPPVLAKAVIALQSHSTSSPTTFAQYGALAAIEGSDDCVAEMCAAFAERRAYLYDRLMAMPGLTCVKPMGAFYMLPSIRAFGIPSVEFANRLLDAEGVALVPGLPFGTDEHVRISYACSIETIEQGMDRLERFCRELG